MRHRLKILTLTLFGCASALFGGDPKDEDRRKLASWKEIHPPFEQLEWAEGVQFGEGTRGLRDAYPFLCAKRGGETFQVTNDNISHFLSADPDGKVIHNSKQAIAAVRFFLSGPLVTTKEAGARITAVAATLPKAAGCSIREGTMPAAVPRAVRVEETRGGTTLGFWKVTLFGLEMSRRLRLVQIDANVTEKGLIQRRVIRWVDGPALIWQTVFLREPTVAERGAEEQRKRVAHHSMIQLAKATRSEWNRDNVWALSRVLRLPGDYEELLGESTGKTEKDQVREITFDLTDKSELTVSSKSKGKGHPFIVDSVSSGVPTGTSGMAMLIDRFRR